MESLDAAVEHLGEAGEVGDISDRQAGIPESLGGASGGDEFYVMGYKGASKVDQAGLIGDGEKSAMDGLEGLERIEVSGHRDILGFRADGIGY
jgi:hypothetical protein